MIEERRELLDCTAQLHKRIAELEAENGALKQRWERTLEHVDELDRQSKALRERAEQAEAALHRKEWLIKEANKPQVGVWCWQGNGEDHLESLSCPVLISADDMRRVVSDKEKAESELAWWKTTFPNQTWQDVSLRLMDEQERTYQANKKLEKAEAACAEMREWIEETTGSACDCKVCVDWKAKRDHALSSNCGQSLIDRMKAMEDILNDACKDTLGHQPPCPPNCPRCRWEVFKQSSL